MFSFFKWKKRYKRSASERILQLILAFVLNQVYVMYEYRLTLRSKKIYLIFCFPPLSGICKAIVAGDPPCPEGACTLAELNIKKRMKKPDDICGFLVTCGYFIAFSILAQKMMLRRNALTKNQVCLQLLHWYSFT